MKEYKVVLYIGGEKQWVSVFAKNKDDAQKLALADISVISVEEVPSHKQRWD